MIVFCFLEKRSKNDGKNLFQNVTFAQVSSLPTNRRPKPCLNLILKYRFKRPHIYRPKAYRIQRKNEPLVPRSNDTFLDTSGPYNFPTCYRKSIAKHEQCSKKTMYCAVSNIVYILLYIVVHSCI